MSSDYSAYDYDYDEFEYQLRQTTDNYDHLLAFCKRQAEHRQPANVRHFIKHCLR